MKYFFLTGIDEQSALLKYGCYTNDLLDEETKRLIVEDSPRIIYAGQPWSEAAVSVEAGVSRLSLTSGTPPPVSKSSYPEVKTKEPRIASGDDSWSPPPVKIKTRQFKFDSESWSPPPGKIKTSPFKFDPERFADKPMKPTSVFDLKPLVPREKVGHVDFTKVRCWRHALELPRIDVKSPMGLCVLNHSFVVASGFQDNRVWMVGPDGDKKELFNGRYPFLKPSDMVALRNGKFAIRGQSCVVTMDGEGKKIRNIWEGKGGMTSFGLAQNDEGHLVCLQETRAHTFLTFFDSDNGKRIRSIEITDIIRDKARSKCRFLTYSKGHLYITDLGLDRIYIVNEKTGDARIFGQSGSGAGEFSDPAGVVVDSEGNIIVADSRNHRLCLFTKEREYVRDVQVCKSKLHKYNCKMINSL